MLISVTVMRRPVGFIPANSPRWVPVTIAQRELSELRLCGEARRANLDVLAYSLDPARAEALWAKSEEMVGERF